MRRFSDHAIAFNQKLCKITTPRLPQPYQMMNPFAKGAALELSIAFYHKYYNDTKPRRIIFGINPGRHGAGLTGIPFTDSKRLEGVLKINAKGLKTHEPSAVFIYQLIEHYGGPKTFYQDFYINSPLPLGLLKEKEKGRFVNANYYDTKTLLQAAQPFIQKSMAAYMTMPLSTQTAYCLGQSQNYRYLKQINEKYNYFTQIIPLPHPRYIVQYKSKEIDQYLKQVLGKLTNL